MSLVTMFAPHVRQSMSALSEPLGAVKAVEGSKFEMNGLDVELNVSKVLVAVRTGAGCLVSGVVFSWGPLRGGGEVT